MIFAGTVLASAQITSSQTAAPNQVQTPSTPVAFVYVSSMPSSGKFEINGYAAASNGSLTAIAGSPFAGQVQYMALNGRWLFGTNGIDIDSFSIASNGALKQVDAAVVGSTSGGPEALFLDHTGATLYDDFINLNGTGNDGYQTYSINQTTGKITFVNEVAGGPDFNSRLRFIGNNVFAYSSSCDHFEPTIFGMKRQSNGALTELNINPARPTPAPGDNYCPFLAAADPTNHVAIAVLPMSGFGSIAGPYQLATYTANTTTGNLTTTSTYLNMPKVAVGLITEYSMAPSGKLLAVGGTSGLQVFHFNGANPITKYTGLLTANEVDQMFWDNANHLYAISRKAGKLYVFTVTTTSFSQAPGSPQSIVNPQNIIVLPKT